MRRGVRLLKCSMRHSSILKTLPHITGIDYVEMWRDRLRLVGRIRVVFPKTWPLLTTGKNVCTHLALLFGNICCSLDEKIVPFEGLGIVS